MRPYEHVCLDRNVVRSMKSIGLMTKLIAEIGWNHMGDMSLAKRMIDEANLATGFALAHLDLATIAAEDVQIAKVTQASGNSALRCLDKALDLAQSNTIDGILFAPFNNLRPD